MHDSAASGSARMLFEAHQRTFEANRYVYPVLSRRAGGLSIGINLNPDKICNFDCVYCQVDRRQAALKQPVDIGVLSDELERMVNLVVSERIYEETRFRATPAELRRLNDIAFSGDGEPTTFPNFDQAVAACAEVRRRHRLDSAKLVLITNATMFHRERVRRALELLDANNGEVWAKLDAGTEAYYLEIARTVIPFRRILENLQSAARLRPIVVQSLFMRIRGRGPDKAELQAYGDRLQEILAAGGQIKLVQVHTVVRGPAERWVTPLPNAEVDAIVDQIRERTSLPVAAYYAT